MNARAFSITTLSLASNFTAYHVIQPTGGALMFRYGDGSRHSTP